MIKNFAGKIKNFLSRTFSSAKKTITDEDGMGVVEVILIILVLVGLALLFKEQITSVAEGIFSSIESQVSEF